MNFREHIAVLAGRSRFLVKVVGSLTGSSGRQSHETSDTKDCSPVAPSTGVLSGCRRTPASSNALSKLLRSDSKDVHRWA